MSITTFFTWQAWFMSPFVVQPILGTCDAGFRYQDVLNTLWFMPDLAERMIDITPVLGRNIACEYAAFLVTTLIFSVVSAAIVLIFCIRQSYKYETTREFHPLKPGKSYSVIASFTFVLFVIGYVMMFVIQGTTMDLDPSSSSVDAPRLTRINTVHPDRIGWGTMIDSLIISGIFMVLALAVFYTFLTVKDESHE
jgi:ABC-type maltose transport system permease subunit